MWGIFLRKLWRPEYDYFIVCNLSVLCAEIHNRLHYQAMLTIPRDLGMILQRSVFWQQILMERLKRTPWKGRISLKTGIVQQLTRRAPTQTLLRRPDLSYFQFDFQIVAEKNGQIKWEWSLASARASQMSISPWTLFIISYSLQSNALND